MRLWPNLDLIFKFRDFQLNRFGNRARGLNGRNERLLSVALLTFIQPPLFFRHPSFLSNHALAVLGISPIIFPFILHLIDVAHLFLYLDVNYRFNPLMKLLLYFIHYKFHHLRIIKTFLYFLLTHRHHRLHLHLHCLIHLIEYLQLPSYFLVHHPVNIIF